MLLNYCVCELAKYIRAYYKVSLKPQIRANAVCGAYLRPTNYFIRDMYRVYVRHIAERWNEMIGYNVKLIYICSPVCCECVMVSYATQILKYITVWECVAKGHLPSVTVAKKWGEPYNCKQTHGKNTSGVIDFQYTLGTYLSVVSS